MPVTGIGADAEVDPVASLVTALNAATAATTAAGVALTNTSARLYLPEAYGAVGDGVTVDTTAVQAALTAAMAASGTLWISPGKTFLVNATILGAATGRLVVRGGGDLSRLRAASGMTGYVLQTRTSYDIDGISLVAATSTDGLYGFGAASGSFGATRIKNFNTYGFDYGIRFHGSARHPLGAVFVDMLHSDFRTCGVMVALNGTPASGLANSDNGQSAWTLDNIIATNGGSQFGRPAAGFTQTDDSPNDTHDTLSWTGSDATEFGWKVMRRPVASVDISTWQWVADVATGTTTYQASKTSAVYYTYAVVRNTCGVYLRYGKVVDIGAIQCEYVGTGLSLREVIGANVSAFYSEWRGGDITNPTPRGNGIELSFCVGVNIQSGWTEGGLSALKHVASSAVRVDNFDAPGCQRSGIHYQTTSNAETLNIGALSLAGTPAPLTTSGSASDSNYVARNVTSTDATLANRMHINHVTLSEWVAEFRGTRSAVLGVDSTSGYTWLSSNTPPTAGSTFDGQIRRNGSTPVICLNLGAGYAWYGLAKDTAISNSQATFLTGKRTDNTAAGSFGYDGAGQPTATPSAASKDFLVTTGGVRVGASGPFWRAGTGSPEGVLTAPVGSLWTRTDGGATTTLYVKESGASNTGWHAVLPASASGTAVLSGGTVTVTDANITANSIIRLVSKTLGGTPGALYISAKTASTSFVITSTSGTDTSTVQYYIDQY